MKKYEYTITAHPSESFRELVVFCSEEGECSLKEVPRDQLERLSGILNDHGKKGWDLVDIAFGKEGLLAFWKREMLH